jgi:pimeloyl-ACP methyl ester carboxylesterase
VAEQPQTQNPIQPQLRGIDAVRIRHARCGRHDGDRLVLLSPWPESFYAFQDRLSPIHTPVRIISGRNDPFVQLADTQYLMSRIPNARNDILDCGHLVWEDQPDAYARIVCDSAGGGYQRISTAKKE